MGKEGLSKIIICAKHEDVKPERKYDALFYDFKAAEETAIESGKWMKIPLGCKVAMPKDCFMEIRPRSGLSLKHGITVLNAPGTVDSDFRGELCAILINHSQETYKVEKGERVCQALFSKHEDYLINIWVNDEVFDDFENEFPSERGSGGFGSTGRK